MLTLTDPTVRRQYRVTARDRIENLTVTPPYGLPHQRDPEFLEDVPGRGTIFSYIGDERVYVSDQANFGLADDTDFLAGTLDAVNGMLNIRAGTGQHGGVLATTRRGQNHRPTRQSLAIGPHQRPVDRLRRAGLDHLLDL